jgi:hypothetical protein
MTIALWKNYLTTAFGILAGLPTLVLSSGVTLDAKWNHILMLIAGVGTIGLGVVAKAYNVHSTPDEVNQQK